LIEQSQFLISKYQNKAKEEFIQTRKKKKKKKGEDNSHQGSNDQFLPFQVFIFVF